MEAAVFAKKVGMPELAVKSWLKEGSLISSMLTDEGAEEFYSLKQSYGVNCCSYLGKEAVIKAIGITDIDLPVHHVFKRSKFYSVAVVYDWVCNHPYLSFNNVRRMLWLSLPKLKRSFAELGRTIPEDPNRECIERRCIEQNFSFAMTAFMDGRFSCASVAELDDSYVSFLSKEKVGWNWDFLVQLCLRDTDMIPFLALDSDYYFSIEQHRAFKDRYRIVDGHVCVSELHVAHILNESLKTLRGMNMSKFGHLCEINGRNWYILDKFEEAVQLYNHNVDKPRSYYVKNYFNPVSLARHFGVTNHWLKTQLKAGKYQPDVICNGYSYYSPERVRAFKPGDTVPEKSKFMFVGDVVQYLRVDMAQIEIYGDYGLTPVMFLDDMIPLYLRSDVIRFSRT